MKRLREFEGSNKDCEMARGIMTGGLLYYMPMGTRRIRIHFEGEYSQGGKRTRDREENVTNILY